MVEFADWVIGTTSDTGTGDLSFTVRDNTFESFADNFSTGGTNVFPYTIRHTDTSINEREVGLAHLDGTSGDLVRDTVKDSTNSGALVNFSSGEKQIILGVSAWYLNALKRKMGGHLEDDGLVIANDSGSPNTIVNVDTGGAVYVEQPDDANNFTIVELAGTESFDISTTGAGGLINTSSLSADSWFELGIGADSSGTNSPVIVGYTDANRPTASADLPTGYDLFRAMGTPGKTWWVRTDGSQNIRQFYHDSSGLYVWTQNELGNFSDLVVTSTPSSGTNESVDASSQMPPTKCNIFVNELTIEADSGGRDQVSVANEQMPDRFAGQAKTFVETSTRLGSGAPIKNVMNQEFFWIAGPNATVVQIRKISSFRAVN